MAKSPLLYLLEVLFCSGMLLAFYRLLLMRQVSFVACRRYLMVAVVLSVAIPALDIPLYPAQTVVYTLPLIKAESEPTQMVAEESIVVEPSLTPTVATTSIDWLELLRWGVVGIYMAIAIGLIVMLLMRVRALRCLRRRSRLTEFADYILAEHPSVATPFSFLRTVFLGDGLEGARRDIVLCHEASHIRHRHSVERIVVESLRCLLWFNPFMWIASRWLQEVQEWEADRDVLDAGYDLTEYRMTIFCQLFGCNPDIACGLNHSLTKNRFVMMTQFKKRPLAALRLGAAIPLVVGMMLLCSFTTRTPDTPTTTIPGAVATIPGLEKLKPTPIHAWTTIIKLPADGKSAELESMSYLPVDDTKYRYVGKGMKVTDLKGTDITWWAMKHYYKKAVNPLFVVDGVKMDKAAYAAYVQQYKDNSNTEALYVGPEVGVLLGDTSIDALLVVRTKQMSVAGVAAPAPTPSSLLAKPHVPVQGKSMNSYGQKTFGNLGDRFHSGVDIAAAEGVEVCAMSDGVISFADVDGGYGQCVRISHSDGYSSTYAHLSQIKVAKDDRVKGGEVIGLVGKTGLATGPHLHFEVAKDGKTIDPATIIDFSQAQSHACISISDGKMLTFNGETIASDKLLTKIGAWREGLSDPTSATVTIKASKNTPMGVVADIKHSLREVNALKINYALNDEEPVARFLPPTPKSSNKKVVVDMPTVKRRNLFLACISGSGAVMAGGDSQQTVVEPDEISELVATFIRNVSGDKSMSEVVIEEFELPDGRKQSYPVSQGLVSMMTMRDTPYMRYVEVQCELTKGFEIVREEVAQKWYNRPYASLTDAQRAPIMRAVPLKISEAEPRVRPQ